jgi:hypothetical protein
MPERAGWPNRVGDARRWYGEPVAMKRMAIAALLALSLKGTASAQGWLTFDATQAAHAIDQIKKELALVQSARTNLLSIPTGFPTGTMPTQIATVTSVLQSAQSCLTQATAARALPPSCAVKYNTSQAQSQALGSSLSHLTELENLARASTGALQSQQANALATIAVAQRLTAMHQLDLASAQQKAIDDSVTVNATTKAGTVNPWAP